MLLPLILDGTVPLDMANRSDGFKRFVSFLLQISAKVKSSEMQDVLLLIDEPEIALNPGGARSLMEELIRVGQTNLVVYSTHSIFMIDKRKINRHLIIERKMKLQQQNELGNPRYKMIKYCTLHLVTLCLRFLRKRTSFLKAGKIKKYSESYQISLEKQIKQKRRICLVLV